MKSGLSTFLIGILFFVVNGKIQSEVSLNDSFALYRNFTNFYIQPDELHSFKLDEFFRGNFLEYVTIANVLDDNRFFYNPAMI